MAGRRIDAPWLSKPEWVEGRIGSQTGSVTVFSWVVAVLWNGLLWPPAVLLWGDPEKSTMVKVLMLFGVVGVMLLFWAFKESLAWFRFGTSVLELATIPGVTGGTLEGRIQTRLKNRPEAPIQITLSCCRRRIREELRSSFDRSKPGTSRQKRTVVTTEPVWQGGCKVPPEMLARESRGLAIPVRVEIPSGLPESNDTDPEDQVVWTLVVTADLPGVDFGAAFPVPVFETEDSRPDLTQEMIDQTAEDRGLLSQPTDPGTSWTPPVSVRWTSRGGVEYTFRPATSLKVAVGVTLLAIAVCAGSAWLWVWLEEAGPFAILPAVFGALLLIASGVVWTFRSKVLIERGAIKVRKSFLGIPLTWEVAVSDIKEIRVQRSLVEGVPQEDQDWEIVIDLFSDEEPKDLGATFTLRSDATRVAEEIDRYAV